VRQVLVQLVGYVASARLRPPSSWCSAVLQALEAALTAQQQHQQQQHWSLTGLLAALVKLRLLPSQQLLQQLQLCAATAQPQLSPEQAAVQESLLHKLHDSLAAAEQRLNAGAVEQQEQQQQQQRTLLQSRAGSPVQQQVARKQQQWPAERGSVAPANSSSSSSSGSSWASGEQSSVAGGPGNAGGPWAGALWVVGSTNGTSSTSSSSNSNSNVSVGAASSKGRQGRVSSDC
jgi:hypothetical protein